MARSEFYDMKRPGGLPLDRPLRVLVVEDTLVSVEILAVLLKNLGHSVDFAIDGSVAYDVARRFRPDVVICDLGLPKQSGFEVAKQIRKDPELSSVRVVALTVHDDEASRQKAKDAGFDEFFVKPVDPSKLQLLLGEKPA
jgi:CheY-like chemotaxis protein